MAPPRPQPVKARFETNLRAVADRVDAARRRSPHAAAEVHVLPVTKSVPADWFPALAAAGVTEVAESRVQAAQARRPGAPTAWRWHGIGHLQRNKARRAVELFDVFHALDSLALAQQVESVLASGNRRWPVYIQVNAADDPQKGGIGPAEALSFVKALADLPHLDPLGFMTMARLDADPVEVRRTFRALREVRDDALRAGAGRAAPAGLSMGMSADFEVAVEEGATVVRVGSALFEGLDLAAPGEAP